MRFLYSATLCGHSITLCRKNSVVGTSGDILKSGTESPAVYYTHDLRKKPEKKRNFQKFRISVRIFPVIRRSFRSVFKANGFYDLKKRTVDKFQIFVYRPEMLVSSTRKGIIRNIFEIFSIFRPDSLQDVLPFRIQRSRCRVDKIPVSLLLRSNRVDRNHSGRPDDHVLFLWSNPTNPFARTDQKSGTRARGGRKTQGGNRGSPSRFFSFGNRRLDPVFGLFLPVFVLSRLSARIFQLAI